MGHVTGLSYGTNDGFDAPGNSIDSIYVDGVSMATTDAAGLRQHIFSFASGACPCAGGPVQPVFVGDNLFCGTSGVYAFDPASPSWVAGTNVCEPADQSVSVPPFFVRTDLLSVTAQREIAVQIMGAEGSDNEDIAVTEMEVYVRE